MGTGNKASVQCKGRFNQVRDFIYQEALPLVLSPDETFITDANLREMWEISQGDIAASGFDWNERYFFCGDTDPIRMSPEVGYLSLVPLIEGHMELEGGLVYNYAHSSMGNSAEVSENLERMANKPPRFLKDLGKNSRDISLPGRKNLSGYRISGNFGIGTLCQGGVSGGGVRSDSPFLLEVYKEDRSGSELAGVVGFWAQNDEMLVSQMQSCKNAKYPERAQFGVASLRVAEAAAEKIGFNKIITYSAQTHPLFRQHPKSWDQLKTEFAQIWDSSAKKLGYDGGRAGYHTKEVKQID